MMPIIDFHCDLLAYLEGQAGSQPSDKRARCSLPQLQAGGVKAQVLAIFVDTDRRSVLKAERQMQIFADLPQVTGSAVEIIDRDWWNSFEEKQTTGIIPAFENASGFCGEEESLETGFDRLASFHTHVANVAYVSLTWNSENRFGGPPGTGIGLKQDGKELLSFLDGRGIAVDLSHASDTMAHDILTAIDIKGLDIPIIASHSNCRAVMDQPRNLPDELIREVISRDGVIGLNFVKKFVGSFEAQIDHFHALGAEEALVLGADFYFEDDPSLNLERPEGGTFDPEFDGSDCYPRFVEKYGITEKTAFTNAKRFLSRV